MGRVVKTFKHNHECIYKDQKFVESVYSRNGAFIMGYPVCQDTNMDLTLLSIEISETPTKEEDNKNV